MPINLKRLLAHSPEGARNEDPSWLGYYQRKLLVGGGVALSVFILVAAVLTSWLEINDYIASRHSTFLIHKSLLQGSIGTKQVSFQRGIASSEHIWRARRRASPALLQRFEAQGGRLVVQRDSYSSPQLAVGSITADRAASAFAEYLAFTEENEYPADTHVLPGGVPLSGYLYNPERTFISILPAPGNSDAPPLADSRDAADLIKRLVADVGDPQQLTNQAGQSSTRAVTWLPPRADPITGEPVVRLVQTALDGNKPFMVVVSNFPVKTLSDSLAEIPYEGAFAIFDRSGKTVLIQHGRGPDDADLASRLVDPGVAHGEAKRYAEDDRPGMFLVSDSLPDTGWTVTYAYSWRTILSALGPRLTLLVIATLAGLLGLWTFVIVFNARVLKPIYLRSLRVVESEMLNRTIIQTAPVGLSLLSATDGGVLLQNDAMRVYEANAISTSLHERLWKTYRKVRETTGSRSDELIEQELTVDLHGREQTHLHFSAIRARYEGIDSSTVRVAGHNSPEEH